MKMKTIFSDKMLLCYFLIILAAATRLLPHPMNFAPIGALGLFSGAYIHDRRAWLIPLIALLISDVLISFYNPFVMLSVYISFALSAVVGRYVLARKRNVLRIGGSAVASATILFVFSNLALWLTGLYYPVTLEGLATCFVRAIPFYGNTLAGDLFYAAVLFGSFEIVSHWMNKQHEKSHVV